MSKLYKQKYTPFLGDGRKKPSTMLNAINKYEVSVVIWLLCAHSSYVLGLQSGVSVCVEVVCSAETSSCCHHQPADDLRLLLVVIERCQAP